MTKGTFSLGEHIIEIEVTDTNILGKEFNPKKVTYSVDGKNQVRIPLSADGLNGLLDTPRNKELVIGNDENGNPQINVCSLLSNSDPVKLVEQDNFSASEFSFSREIKVKWLLDQT